MRFLVCVALLATVGVPVHGAFVSVPAHGHATVRSRNHAPVVALFGTKVKPAKVAAKRSFSFFPIPDGAKKARNQKQDDSSFSLPDFGSLSLPNLLGIGGSVTLSEGAVKLKGLPAIGFLAASLGAPLVVLVAVAIITSGKLPDQSPFAFLDGFYPPAIEKKRQVKLAREAAEKAEAARKAAEKAEADRIAAEKAEADKIAAEKAAKEKEAAEKAAKEKEAAAAAVAKAKAAAEARMAARTPPSPKGAQPKYAAYQPKYDADRVGKPAAYPMINKEMAGKPGFNAQGEPTFPGAMAAYQAQVEQAQKQALRAEKVALEQEAAKRRVEAGKAATLMLREKKAAAAAAAQQANADKALEMKVSREARAASVRAAEKERIEADKAKVEKAAEMKVYREARAASVRAAEKERIEAITAKIVAKQGERAADKAASGVSGM